MITPIISDIAPMISILFSLSFVDSCRTFCVNSVFLANVEDRHPICEARSARACRIILGVTRVVCLL